MPEVLNKHYAPVGVDDVYIGRPSKWGNPYVIGPDGNRQQVIEKYEAHLYDSGLIDDILELRGKNLVCWCAPRPCHGDVLLRLANGALPLTDPRSRSA